MNSVILLFALIAVIAGFVLAVQGNEIKSGTFWLVVAVVLLEVIPRLAGIV